MKVREVRELPDVRSQSLTEQPPELLDEARGQLDRFKARRVLGAITGLLSAGGLGGAEEGVRVFRKSRDGRRPILTRQLPFPGCRV